MIEKVKRHRILIKAVATVVVCLFMFNSVSFAAGPARTGGDTLSPSSKFNPIVKIKKNAEGRFIVVEDRAEKKRLLRTGLFRDTFNEDVALLYLSSLIGQALHFGISHYGLKDLIRDHLGHIAFDRFKWEEITKEGNEFHLPYERADRTRQVLKFFLPGEKDAEFPHHVNISIDGEKSVVLEDPLEEKRDRDSIEKLERFACAVRSIRHTGEVLDIFEELGTLGTILMMMLPKLSGYLTYKVNPISKQLEELRIDLSRIEREGSSLSKKGQLRADKASEYAEEIRAIIRTYRLTRSKLKTLFEEEVNSGRLSELPEFTEIMHGLSIVLRRLENTAGKLESRAQLAEGKPVAEKVVLSELLKHKAFSMEGLIVVNNTAKDLLLAANEYTLLSALLDIANNAVHYSRKAREGGSSESAKMELSEEHGYLEIKISDNGEGISPELLETDPVMQRPRLFNLNTSEREGGTGLGTTEAWYAVRDIGGTIDVESGPGGTTFYIRIPTLEGLINKAVKENDLYALLRLKRYVKDGAGLEDAIETLLGPYQYKAIKLIESFPGLNEYRQDLLVLCHDQFLGTDALKKSLKKHGAKMGVKLFEDLSERGMDLFLDAFRALACDDLFGIDALREAFIFRTHKYLDAMLAIKKRGPEKFIKLCEKYAKEDKLGEGCIKDAFYYDPFGFTEAIANLDNMGEDDLAKLASERYLGIDALREAFVNDTDLFAEFIKTLSFLGIAVVGEVAEDDVIGRAPLVDIFKKDVNLCRRMIQKIEDMGVMNFVEFRKKVARVLGEEAVKKAIANDPISFVGGILRISRDVEGFMDLLTPERIERLKWMTGSGVASDITLLYKREYSGMEEDIVSSRLISARNMEYYKAIASMLPAGNRRERCLYIASGADIALSHVLSGGARETIFVDRLPFDMPEALSAERMAYYKAQYFRDKYQSGYTNLVTLGHIMGAVRYFLLWELEAMGVDLATVRIEREGKSLTRVYYKMPVSGEERRIIYMQVDDVTEAGSYANKLRGLLAEGLDSYIQKACMKIVLPGEVVDIIADSLNPDSMVFMDSDASIKHENLLAVSEKEMKEIRQLETPDEVSFGYEKVALFRRKKEKEPPRKEFTQAREFLNRFRTNIDRLMSMEMEDILKEAADVSKRAGEDDLLDIPEPLDEDLEAIEEGRYVERDYSSSIFPCHALLQIEELMLYAKKHKKDLTKSDKRVIAAVSSVSSGLAKAFESEKMNAFISAVEKDACVHEAVFAHFRLEGVASACQVIVKGKSPGRKKQSKGKKTPPKGSLYGVFEYLSEKDAARPLTADEIAAALGRAYKTIEPDLAGLERLHLVERTEGTRKKARYFVPERVRNKTGYILSILSEFTGDLLRPDRDFLDRTYRTKIQPISDPAHLATEEDAREERLELESALEEIKQLEGILVLDGEEQVSIMIERGHDGEELERKVSELLEKTDIFYSGKMKKRSSFFKYAFLAYPKIKRSDIDIEMRPVDNTLLLVQGEWAVTNAEDENHKLATFAIGMCYGILLHNPRTRTAALVHIDFINDMNEVISTVDEMAEALGAGREGPIYIYATDNLPETVFREATKGLNYMGFLPREFVFDTKTAKFSEISEETKRYSIFGSTNTYERMRIARIRVGNKVQSCINRYYAPGVKGDPEEEPEIVDIKALIEERVNSIRAGEGYVKLKDLKVKIIVSLPVGLHVIIRPSAWKRLGKKRDEYIGAWKDDLRQVLTELLANAMEGRSGYVEGRAEHEVSRMIIEVRHESGKILIHITDDGDGITEKGLKAFKGLLNGQLPDLVAGRSSKANGRTKDRSGGFGFMVLFNAAAQVGADVEIISKKVEDFKGQSGTVATLMIPAEISETPGPEEINVKDSMEKIEIMAKPPLLVPSENKSKPVFNIDEYLAWINSEVLSDPRSANVRLFTEGDIRRIGALSARIAPSSVPAVEKMARNILAGKEKGRQIFVYEEGGEVLGYINFSFDSTHEAAHITGVSVDSEHEGSGIASLLLGAAMRTLSSEGISSYSVDIISRSKLSFKLFKRFGFEKQEALKKIGPAMYSLRLAPSRSGTDLLRERHEKFFLDRFDSVADVVSDSVLGIDRIKELVSARAAELELGEDTVKGMGYFEGRRIGRTHEKVLGAVRDTVAALPKDGSREIFIMTDAELFYFGNLVRDAIEGRKNNSHIVFINSGSFTGREMGLFEELIEKAKDEKGALDKTKLFELFFREKLLVRKAKEILEANTVLGDIGTEKVRFIDTGEGTIPLFLEAALNAVLRNDNTSSLLAGSHIDPADAVMTGRIDRDLGGISTFEDELDLYKHGKGGTFDLNAFFAHLVLTHLFLEKHAPRMEKRAAEEVERTAVGFSDALRVLAGKLRSLKEAENRSENIIIALDTSWAEKLEVRERSASQGLLCELARLPLELKKLGLGNVTILRGRGESLAREIMQKAGEKNTPLSNVVVLAGGETLRARSFRDLMSTAGKDRAFVAKVDPSILIKKHSEIKKADEAVFVPYLDMIEAALKLAFDERVLSECEHVNFMPDKERPRFYHFIPKARTVPADKLKMLYDRQAQVMFAA